RGMGADEAAVRGKAGATAFVSLLASAALSVPVNNSLWAASTRSLSAWDCPGCWALWGSCAVTTRVRHKTIVVEETNLSGFIIPPQGVFFCERVLCLLFIGPSAFFCNKIGVV